MLLLTGDVHHPFAVQISDNVWEFRVSPTNSAGHPLGTAGLPPPGGWFDSQGRKVQIKWCGGNPDHVHYLRQRHSVYSVINLDISTLDAKPEGAAFPEINRFSHWRKDLEKR